MIKDRAQKASALRLCVSKRWYPYMEVDVAPTARLEKSRVALTDLDVLAVAQTPLGDSVRYVFDCKSGARESGISRAFWLRGVMTGVNAAHGFVVLSDKVTLLPDHRVSSKELSVTLLREGEFEQLANGIGGTTVESGSACANLDAWEWFLSPQSNDAIKRYMAFSRSMYWMHGNPGSRCRNLIAKVQEICSELDPAKPLHFALFCDALSLLLLAVAELTNQLFLVLLKPATSVELSNTLASILFGGAGGVDAVIKMRALVAPDAIPTLDSVFPELRRFEQLVRQAMTAPGQIHHAALLVREIAYSEGGNLQTTDFQVRLIQEAPFVPKFIVLAADFLRRACRLPADMDARLSDIVLQLHGLYSSGKFVPTAGDGRQ